MRGIDRRQVKQDLLEALMSFARKMHTKVIAEGIETREELRVLQSLGVPYGQGFLLARPMPVADIERFASIAISPRDVAVARHLKTLSLWESVG